MAFGAFGLAVSGIAIAGSENHAETAALLEQQGKPAEALKHLEQAISEKGAPPGLAIEAARQEYNIGDYRAARVRLRAYLDACGQDMGRCPADDRAEAKVMLGSLALLFNELKQAEGFFKETAKERPAVSAWGLAEVERLAHRFEAAEQHYDRAVRAAEEAGNEGLRDLALAGAGRNAIAELDLGRAERIFSDLYQRRAEKGGSLGAGDLSTAGAYGYVLMKQGKYDEAVKVIEPAIAVGSRVLGENHVETLILKFNHALIRHARGDYDAAVKSIAEVKAGLAAALGEGHAYHSKVAMAEARLAYHQGRNAECEAILKAVLAGAAKTAGRSLETVEALRFQGYLRLREGKYDQALGVFGQSLKEGEALLGKKNPVLYWSHAAIGRTYRKMGKLDEATKAIDRGVKILAASLAVDHPFRVSSDVTLASVLLETGDLDRAEKLAARALGAREAKLEPNHHLIADTASMLARIVAAKGEVAKGIELMNRAIRIRETTQPGNTGIRGEEHFYLGGMHEKAGDKEAARRSYEMALGLMKGREDSNNPIYEAAKAGLERVK